ncbi:MAG: right-handed parallel beta-helix repeat-containing protein, partial [Oscillospiraceae bacterium]|nr:right-handed parallel beta-helix repeat-containing protein [Oscillospiraceae bacterium]
MTELFYGVLKAGFHGGIVILAVVLLRIILRMAPKKYVRILWMLAFLRLVLPVEIPNPISLQPEPVLLQQEQVIREEAYDRNPEDVEEIPDRQQSFQTEEGSSETQISDNKSNANQQFRIPWRFVLPIVWLSGMTVLLAYSTVSYIRLKSRVREAVKISGGWESEQIKTAFILGYLHPRIYVPMGLDESTCGYILAHERAHLKKGDHWFKLTAYLVLSIHWYHPLVWLAYVLLSRDIELACDEDVVRGMKLQERKAYSAALLQCSVPKAYFASCPVAFAEVSVKERIMSVMKNKKPAVWLSIIGVLSILFVAVFLLTSPAKAEEEPAEEPDAASEQETSAERPEAPVPAAVPSDGIYRVDSADAFLEAIGSDREIVLKAGTYRLEDAALYGIAGEHYRWEENDGGSGLVITGVENLTIRGEGKEETQLLTAVSSVSVLEVEDSSGIVLSDITLGHEPVGSCSGNIVEFNRCETVYLHDMGLFGCGVVGLRAEDCTDVFVEHSEIYECAQSAAEFVRSEQISFVGCKIFGIGTSEEPAKAAVLLTDAESVQFVGCEFYDNTAETLVSGTADRVSVSGSAIQNNKLISACFAVMSEDFHLDTNWFTENDMPHWFAPGTAETENHSGNPETEVDAESASQDELPAQEEIRVSNVDELLDAIGPNRKIILTSETYDLSTATGYGEARGTYWYWIERHDGPELSIFGVDNMTICGESGEITAHTIEAVPRYADVLFFDTCT